MRENWKYKPLGEICDFVGGSQPPKNEWINTCLNGYVRMLQIRDFTKSRDSGIEYVKLSKKLRLCKEDDILLGRYGASVGKVLTGLEGAYNVAIIKSMPNSNYVSKSYIKRYFESSLFQSNLLRICNSRTAQAGFSKEDIYSFIVPVPPLSEQERIVALLDDQFAKIDALKANADQQLKAAKALFQSALKEMLTPKEGWDEKTLGEICDFSSGFAFKSNLFSSVGEPIIRISDIQDEMVIEDNVARFDIKSYNVDLSRYIVYPEDILIAMSGGTTGKVGINNTGKCFYLNQRVGVFREKKDKLNHKYLFYYLKTKSDESLKIAAGAAQPNLSTAQIKNFVVPLPSLPEQERIAARLDAISEKVKALQTNYDQTINLCNDLKQSLLKSIFA